MERGSRGGGAKSGGRGRGRGSKEGHERRKDRCGARNPFTSTRALTGLMGRNVREVAERRDQLEGKTADRYACFCILIH